MIIVTIKGGLGNQMFQYAFARTVAKHLNTQFKLDLSWFTKVTRSDRRYLLDRFNICNDIVTIEDIESSLSGINQIPGYQPVGELSLVGDKSINQYYFDPSSDYGNRLIELKDRFIGNGCQFYKEPHFHFDIVALTVVGNIWFDGYWQSERYFKNVKDDLLSEFKLRLCGNPFDSAVEDLINGFENSVSVHVRRGDAVSNPDSIRVHGSCGLNYYLGCMNIIASKFRDPLFFIFSDDPQWVEDCLLPRSSWPTRLVNHNDEQQCYYDLKLMSQCKHHIVSNSTFSWWAAWLGVNGGKYKDSTILYPKHWFEDTSLNTKDLFPDGWTCINLKQ